VEVGNERCKSTHDDLRAGGLHGTLFDIGERIVNVPDSSGQSKTAYEVLNLGQIFVKLGNYLNCAKVYFLSYRSLTEEKSYLSFDDANKSA
jgi:hypothetical protein